MTVVKFISCGERIVRLALDYGWWPAARYTNLRTVRSCGRLGFLDIDWRNYDFCRHIEAATHTRPLMTVARDVTNHRTLDRTLREAEELARFADLVVIVPKDRRIGSNIRAKVGPSHVLGFSVPSSYGQTSLKPENFEGPVHLLGGRPDVQRSLARYMNVVSFDCNRFTLDAKFGWAFDGSKFRRQGKIGYDACICLSMEGINRLWEEYENVAYRACALTKHAQVKLRRGLGMR